MDEITPIEQQKWKIIKNDEADWRQAVVSADGVFIAGMIQDRYNAELIKDIPEMLKTLEAAYNALRSYQYGNQATDLAESVGNACDFLLVKHGVHS